MRDVCNRKMGGKGNARNASAAELVASALVSTAVFIYRRGEEISIRYELVILCSTITSANSMLRRSKDNTQYLYRELWRGILACMLLHQVGVTKWQFVIEALAIIRMMTPWCGGKKPKENEMVSSISPPFQNVKHVGVLHAAMQLRYPCALQYDCV